MESFISILLYTLYLKSDTNYIRNIFYSSLFNYDGMKKRLK